MYTIDPRDEVVKFDGVPGHSVAGGTVLYSLGFGTGSRDARDAMFDLFDRIAKSFVPEQSPESVDTTWSD
jgi:hypothetical protein